ncbi:hypothetical protein GCM10011584_10600 [Nocardioides phosphati]|uniref:Trp biosynthesis-associated membrane protein n=1 Tax=Nocardioides phosphati TaxID=1867775 RepID=A0ABQ2N7T1_9ACTN|nr:Trp biosynthesis-associated membrane protein [Nocardioides phosphati]GGO87009.1 hypothetical protein GCM10011584_10600 [Nocardioides phosphati]
MTRRGSFGPVVLLGLASSALAAVAGNKPMVTGSGRATSHVSVPGIPGIEDKLPLAGALGLVLLASWGVLLVLRGRVRRAIAALAALLALGTLLAAVVGLPDLRASYRSDLVKIAAGSTTVHTTGWFATLLVASALALVAGVLAVLLARDWPEMGSKYDAPSAGDRPRVVPLAEQSSVDLWKSLDAGHDPTRDPDAHDDPPA